MEKRIEWIDIFKALAIVMVVIGHSTGKFNAYIYQFHVAAFFFISGYVSKMDKVSIGKELYKKTITLIFPVITMVILYGILLNILSFFHVYSYFYEDQVAPTVGILVKNFVTNGSMIDLLGAAWFVLVLYFCSIISHFMYKLCVGRKVVFGLVTILLYIYGYFKMKTGSSLPFGIDIAFVAQGFYGIAFLTKLLVQNVVIIGKKKYWIICFGMVCSSCIMVLMGEKLSGKNLMDIANRQMNSLPWCTIAVINGVIWLWSLSQLISLVRISWIKKICVVIGKSTMGIMVLHFMFFRIVAMLLSYIGIISNNECRNLIPSAEVGTRYWWIYSLVAIIGSTVLWNSLIKIPILNCALGKNNEWAWKLLKFEPCQDLVNVYRKIISVVYCGLTQLWEKKSVNAVIGCVFVCIIIWCGRYGTSLRQMELVKEQNVIFGEVNVTFPYNESNIIFNEGWLEQVNSEKYRWVRQESEFQIGLSNQTKITMLGYLPEGFKEITNVKLYLNDKLIADENIFDGQEITLEGELSKGRIEGNNVFKIVFDGEHIPNKEAEDQRSFSAMFFSIKIE